MLLTLPVHPDIDVSQRAARAASCRVPGLDVMERVRHGVQRIVECNAVAVLLQLHAARAAHQGRMRHAGMDMAQIVKVICMSRRAVLNQRSTRGMIRSKRPTPPACLEAVGANLLICRTCQPIKPLQVTTMSAPHALELKGPASLPVQYRCLQAPCCARSAAHEVHKQRTDSRRV